MTVRKLARLDDGKKAGLVLGEEADGMQDRLLSAQNAGSRKVFGGQMLGDNENERRNGKRTAAQGRTQSNKSAYDGT